MNTPLSYKSRYSRYINLKTKSNEGLSFKHILENELQVKRSSLFWEYHNPYSNNLLYDSSYDYEHRKEYCYYNRYNINFISLDCSIHSGIPIMQKIRSYTFKFHKKLIKIYENNKR